MSNFVTKTWVNRDVEFPTRRTETLVNGTASTYDYARTEGTVYAEGDLPDAPTLNLLEGRIDDAFADTEAEIDKIATTSEFAVLTTDWTAETGGYYATKTLTGATTSDIPHVSLRSATSYPTATEKANALLITDITAGTDTVTFHATATPSATVNLEVRL